MSPNRRTTTAPAGFTLMEILVVMALLTLLLGMTIPYVGGVLGVQVRSAARQLAGTIRYTFDEAVLESSNFRIVFNLDRHAYTVERCSGTSTAILYRSAEERERGEERLAEKLRRLEDYAQSRSGMGGLPLADTLLQSCSQSQDPNLAPVILEEPLTLLGVWTPQYPDVMRGDPDGPPDDPAEDQIVVVNFLKGGYVERAFIYLSDGGDDIYTLEIEPLTGMVNMYNGEYEIPREYWQNARGRRWM